MAVNIGWVKMGLRDLLSGHAGPQKNRCHLGFMEPWI